MVSTPRAFNLHHWPRTDAKSTLSDGTDVPTVLLTDDPNLAITASTESDGKSTRTRLTSEFSSSANYMAIPYGHRDTLYKSLREEHPTHPWLPYLEGKLDSRGYGNLTKKSSFSRTVICPGNCHDSPEECMHPVHRLLRGEIRFATDPRSNTLLSYEPSSAVGSEVVTKGGAMEVAQTSVGSFELV
jgi:hypothetical protein